jgi:hypothetical protein
MISSVKNFSSNCESDHLKASAVPKLNVAALKSLIFQEGRNLKKAAQNNV